MTGSQMPRLAASYFGFSTNQAPDTLTPRIATSLLCIDQTACCSRCPSSHPPNPLSGAEGRAMTLPHLPQRKVSMKIVPCMLRLQVGALLLWHFEVTYLTFPFFSLWLFCGGAADCGRTICLPACYQPPAPMPPYSLLYCDACAAAIEHKWFSVNKHEDGEKLLDFNTDCLKVSLPSLFESLLYMQY